jgi:hypothetical protein
MFFLALTVSLILLLSGIVLLIESSYFVGSILLGVGIISLILLIWYYQSRNRKKEKEGLDCLDCNFAAVDCPNLSLSKKMDCDCDGDKGFDCDCSPN